MPFCRPFLLGHRPVTQSVTQSVGFYALAPCAERDSCERNLVGKCVPVPSPHERRVGVPEQLGDSVRRHSCGERVRRIGVPQLVQAECRVGADE